MTIPLPWTFSQHDPAGHELEDRLQEVIDVISLQFPIGAANLVGSLQGTSLPTNPSNGQDYYYVADDTNGVVWHLKYRAASASTYKWEFVGGPPLFVQNTNTETTASLTYVALATAGPSITVPLAGDYLVQHGHRAANTNAGAACRHSYDIGGTGAVDADSVFHETAAVNVYQNEKRAQVKAGLAASTALVSKYRVSAGTATFSDRWLLVTPQRVT